MSLLFGCVNADCTLPPKVPMAIFGSLGFAFINERIVMVHLNGRRMAPKGRKGSRR